MCKDQHCQRSDAASNPFEKKEFIPLADSGRCCTNPKPQREPGFYWVRCKENETAIFKGWAIREWASSEKRGTWIVDLECVDDSYWSEIDERRIERKPIEGTECGYNNINSEVLSVSTERYIRKLIQDYIPVDDELLSIPYLCRIHTGLTEDDALDLLCFCRNKTIERKECYGNGSIMYDKWIESKKP